MIGCCLQGIPHSGEKIQRVREYNKSVKNLS